MLVLLLCWAPVGHVRWWWRSPFGVVSEIIKQSKPANAIRTFSLMHRPNYTFAVDYQHQTPPFDVQYIRKHLTERPTHTPAYPSCVHQPDRSKTFFLRSLKSIWIDSHRMLIDSVFIALSSFHASVYDRSDELIFRPNVQNCVGWFCQRFLFDVFHFVFVRFDSCYFVWWRFCLSLWENQQIFFSSAKNAMSPNRTQLRRMKISSDGMLRKLPLSWSTQIGNNRVWRNCTRSPAEPPNPKP